MQVTEFARAKALAKNSPRSSPDVQGKEAYLKKRHSLPGANGRHGSPHIKRTSPQAQQTTKGTDKGGNFEDFINLKLQFLKSCFILGVL